MKVLCFPADRAGCGWYRVRWPAAQLQAQGRDVELRERYTHGDNLGRPDVVVIQRPLKMKVVEWIEWLQANDVAVVVEIDDSLHHLPKGHPMRPPVVRIEEHPTEQTRVALERCCELADLVTVTTPALARLYGAHGRVEVIPNMIPEARIRAGLEHMHTRGGRKVVGYSGPAHFHAWDLRVVGKGLQRAQADAGFDFYGIGDPKLHQILRLRGSSDHWFDMHDYGPGGYVAHQARFDVGLAPLELRAFNDCKSDLKVLELAAIGVPVVASPSPAYAALAELGVCVTAATPADWHAQVLEQLEQPLDAEHLIGYAATRTFEHNVDRWWRAWEKARANR